MQTQDNEITENQPDPAPESTEQHTPETTPSLEEMIRQAELKAEEHHDAWLCAKIVSITLALAAAPATSPSA